MSEPPIKINAGSDFGVTMLAVVLAYIFFYGDPDLLDALIHHFVGK